MLVRLTHRGAAGGDKGGPSLGTLMIVLDERGEQRVAAYAGGDPANPLAFVFWPQRRRWTGPRKVTFLVWPGQPSARMAECLEVALARTVLLPDGSLPR